MEPTAVGGHGDRFQIAREQGACRTAPVGLILRGVAFEFRYKTEAMRWVWDLGFFLGSLVVAFVQGAAIGAMVEELPVEGGQFAGGAFVWLTPFAIWCCLGLVFGYTLLGAAWLILKTEGELREWAYRRVPWLLGAVLVFLLVAFVFAVAEPLRVMDRWLDRPALLIFPVIGALATLGLYLGLRRRRDGCRS
jgi:cytochrome bd ubiquinol oxidase subunit II